MLGVFHFMIMWARHEVAGYCMMSYDNDVLRSQHTDTEPVVQQLANSVAQNVQPLWQRIGSAMAVTDQFAGTKAPAHSNTGFFIPWHWPGGFPRKAKCKVLNIKSGHDGRLVLQKTLWQPDTFFHIPCVNYTSLLILEKRLCEDFESPVVCIYKAQGAAYCGRTITDITKDLYIFRWYTRHPWIGGNIVPCPVFLQVVLIRG